jgi:nucleoside-diphosphate-sugar epimerase
MRLLITGGTGCLGASIAERYLARGAEVLSVDNFATSDPGAISPREGYRLVEGSVADPQLMASVFAEFRPTHVVHSAASYKDPDDWAGDVNTNVMGTVHVLKQAAAVEVRRFVFLQTALCYGRALERPIRIQHPLAPFTSYSITKTAAEQLVAISRLSWVSLRLANVYGPRHYSGPIPTFYKRLKAKQKCFVAGTRRDFLEMADFLSLIDIVLDSDCVGAFNVSSGTDVSIKDVFDQIVRHMGIELGEPVRVEPPQGDDVANLLLDPSETERQFGWKAGIGLDEGIRRQIAWFDANGVGETYTHLAIGRR